MKLFIENNDFLSEDFDENSPRKIAVSFDITVDDTELDASAISEFIAECISSKDGIELVSEIDVDYYY